VNFWSSTYILIYFCWVAAARVWGFFQCQRTRAKHKGIPTGGRNSTAIWSLMSNSLYFVTVEQHRKIPAMPEVGLIGTCYVPQLCRAQSLDEVPWSRSDFVGDQINRRRIFRRELIPINSWTWRRGKVHCLLYIASMSRVVRIRRVYRRTSSSTTVNERAL